VKLFLKKRLGLPICQKENKVNFKFFSIIVFISVPFLLAAKPVHLENFVEEYMKNSLNIEIDLNNLLMTEKKIQQAEGVYDMSLSLLSKYTYQKKQDISSLVSLDNSKITTIGMELSKTFEAAGTGVVLSHDLSYLKSPYSETSTSLSQAKYQGNLSLALIQPFLKNAFGILNRYPKKKLEIQKKIDSVYHEEIKEQEKLSAVSDYLDWLYYSKQIETLNDIIDNYQKVYLTTADKYKKGLASLKNLETARSNVLLYEKQRIEIKKLFELKKIDISRWVVLEKEDVPDLTLLDKMPEVYESKETGENRSLKIALMMIEQLKLNILSYENTELPDLNLIASYTLKSGQSEMSGIYGGLSTKEWYLGVQFSFLFGNNEAEGKLKAEELLKNQKQTEYQRLLKIFSAEQKKALAELKLIQETLSKQKEYIASLTRKYAEQRKGFFQGTEELETLFQTANDLSSARLEFIYLSAAYLKKYYLYQELIDSLL